MTNSLFPKSDSNGYKGSVREKMTKTHQVLAKAEKPLSDATRPSRSRAKERHLDIYHEIRKRICLLTYLPGTRLKETTLANEFGVSRSPIREVICHLESDGLIETRHGAGTYVTDVELENLLKVYELRVHLAFLVGELDPVPCAADDIAKWRNLLEELRGFSRAPDLIGYAQIVMTFHQLMLQRVGNDSLRELIDLLFHQTNRIWVNNLTGIDWTVEITALTSEINQLIQAMEVGDLRGVALSYRHAISASVKRFSRYRS